MSTETTFKTSATKRALNDAVKVVMLSLPGETAQIEDRILPSTRILHATTTRPATSVVGLDVIIAVVIVAIHITKHSIDAMS